jgi:glycosyltransferase involved in cell wall biosynthesis
MNILIDGFFYQLSRSGISVLWTNLINTWANDRNEINLYFLDRGQRDLQFNKKVEIINHPQIDIDKAFSDFNTKVFEDDRLLLNEICKENNIDIFMSTYYTYVDECPNLLLVYDLIPEVFPDVFNLNEPIWKQKSLGIYSSQAYLCISENTAKDLLRFYKISGRYVSYSHLAANDSWVSSKPANEKKSKNIPYVVVPGLEQFESYKNQGIIFKSLRHLVEKKLIRIVCTGKKAKTQIKSYSNLIDIDLVECTLLEEKDLVYLFKNALAVIFPSSYEGFGLPLLEAFSTGTPIITCKNSSLEEIGSCWAIYIDRTDVFKLREVIENLLDIPNEVKTIYSNNIQNYSSLFEWEKFCLEVDKIARQLSLSYDHSKWLEAHNE